MDVKKGSPIRGPLGVTLYPEGVEYFRSNLIDLESKRIEYPAVEARPLQMLAFRGLLEFLDYEVRNITSDRGNLIDITKLMAYGMLYRQFEARIWDLLLGSDLVHLWNSEYPKFAILAGVNPRSPALRVFLGTHKDLIREVKQRILGRILAHIDKDSRLQESERRKRRFLALKFLNFTDPFAWLLVGKFWMNPQAKSLADEIYQVLEQFLPKSDVPENLSLLLVELAVIVGGLASLEFGTVTHDPMRVRFSFSPRSREMGERTLLRVVLLPVGLGDSFSEADDAPYLDTLLDSPENKNLANREILGYYYSYLKKSCRVSNILLETAVTPVQNASVVGMSLSLTFQ